MTRPAWQTVSIQRVKVTGLPAGALDAGALRVALASEIARCLEGRPVPRGLADGARLAVTARTTAGSGGVMRAARLIAQGIAGALGEGHNHG